jgi:hypothetical protein
MILSKSCRALMRPGSNQGAFVKRIYGVSPSFELIGIRALFDDAVVMM